MSRQDQGVNAPRVRLGKLLTLVRILAGHRGHAVVSWAGQGFRYTLAVRRASPVPLELDSDPDAPGAEAVIALLRDALDLGDGS